MKLTLRTVHSRLAARQPAARDTDDRAFDLTPVLEWYERDVRDPRRLEDIPAGLSQDARRARKRVQPSRDADRKGDDS